MPILPLLLFILPLGIDTLGISISIGMKSRRKEILEQQRNRSLLPIWLSSALLFSLAETFMPLAGLLLGYAVSLFISNIVHILGPLVLVGVGLWELLEEVLEHRKKKTAVRIKTSQSKQPSPGHFQWRRQLFLALSISMDELAIGFSLGTVTVSRLNGQAISPIILCILIGVQGFLMTLIGIALGRTLRISLGPVKDWTEYLSAFLLIGLGVWLLFL